MGKNSQQTTDYVNQIYLVSNCIFCHCAGHVLWPPRACKVRLSKSQTDPGVGLNKHHEIPDLSGNRVGRLKKGDKIASGTRFEIEMKTLMNPTLSCAVLWEKFDQNIFRESLTLPNILKWLLTHLYSISHGVVSYTRLSETLRNALKVFAIKACFYRAHTYVFTNNRSPLQRSS